MGGWDSLLSIIVDDQIRIRTTTYHIKLDKYGSWTTTLTVMIFGNVAVAAAARSATVVMADMQRERQWAWPETGGHMPSTFQQ